MHIFVDPLQKTMDDKIVVTNRGHYRRSTAPAAAAIPQGACRAGGGRQEARAEDPVVYLDDTAAMNKFGRQACHQPPDPRETSARS